MQSNKLTLISQEGEVFKIDVAFRNMCGHLKDMLEEKEDITSEDIPLPTISSANLKAIIEYCEHFNFVKDPRIPYPLPSNNLA